MMVPGPGKVNDSLSEFLFEYHPKGSANKLLVAPTGVKKSAGDASEWECFYYPKVGFTKNRMHTA
ncbi:hypothetical protein SAMN04487787_12244 [Kosakonia sacchari]|nr:hypothetical protein SAMN04487787_12244 [Kosakonia sacchari]